MTLRSLKNEFQQIKRTERKFDLSYWELRSLGHSTNDRFLVESILKKAIKKDPLISQSFHSYNLLKKTDSFNKKYAHHNNKLVCDINLDEYDKFNDVLWNEREREKARDTEDSEYEEDDIEIEILSKADIKNRLMGEDKRKNGAYKERMRKRIDNKGCYDVIRKVKKRTVKGRLFGGKTALKPKVDILKKKKLINNNNTILNFQSLKIQETISEKLFVQPKSSQNSQRQKKFLFAKNLKHKYAGTPISQVSLNTQEKVEAFNKPTQPNFESQKRDKKKYLFSNNKNHRYVDEIKNEEGLNSEEVLKSLIIGGDQKKGKFMKTHVPSYLERKWKGIGDKFGPTQKKEKSK